MYANFKLKGCAGFTVDNNENNLNIQLIKGTFIYRVRPVMARI